MRYKPDHLEQSRSRILNALGRGFRSHGFAGIGVDGLARAAGVTSGAFYGHFSSKSDAFREALRSGLMELLGGLKTIQKQHGEDWVEPFVTFYLGVKRTCDLAETCTLPTLSAEVERCDAGTRAMYEEELECLADAVADGFSWLEEGIRKERAWAFLSLLAGGLTISRAVESKSSSDEIATAIIAAAVQLSR